MLVTLLDIAGVVIVEVAVVAAGELCEDLGRLAEVVDVVEVVVVEAVVENACCLLEVDEVECCSKWR